MAGDFVLYMHRCTITGKAYIGITCRGVRARLHSHESEARRGSSLPFHRAIRKYGITSFETSVLADGLSERDAKNAEIDAIARFATFGRGGYNATLGGDGTTSAPISTERRAAISAQFKLMPRTVQHRAKISAALRGKAKQPHVIEAAAAAKRGKPQSPITAENSRAALGKAQAIWVGSSHSATSKTAMRAAKSRNFRIVRPDGTSEVINTTIRALAEASDISASAICAALKAGRAIAKPGPLLGCIISKVERDGNGRAS